MIVFVHGIFGDADTTWRFSPNTYWPRLLLTDETFRQSDVYVANYSSPYFGNTMNLDEVVTNLNNRLTSDEVFSKHREVVFVCHSLGGTAIRDLTPIQQLTNMTRLGIGGTQVTDLSPIRNFRHLQVLNLGGAPVSDLSPLADIETLTEMSMTGTEVASLATFPRKDSLRTISVYDSGTVAVDLSPVGQLSGLESVDLFVWGPQGFDVSFVRQLKQLTKLSITGNGFDYISPVTGLGAIGELSSLRTLHLFGIQIKDLVFLTNAQNLNEITVTNAPLTNISALRRIKSLTIVSLTGTLVVDVSPLLDLPKLTAVSITRTPARSDVVTELERRGVKVQR